MLKKQKISIYIFLAVAFYQLMTQEELWKKITCIIAIILFSLLLSAKVKES